MLETGQTLNATNSGLSAMALVRYESASDVRYSIRRDITRGQTFEGSDLPPGRVSCYWQQGLTRER